MQFLEPNQGACIFVIASGLCTYVQSIENRRKLWDDLIFIIQPLIAWSFKLAIIIESTIYSKKPANSTDDKLTNSFFIQENLKAYLLKTAMIKNENGKQSADVPKWQAFSRAGPLTFI